MHAYTLTRRAALPTRPRRPSSSLKRLGARAARPVYYRADYDGAKSKKKIFHGRVVLNSVAWKAPVGTPPVARLVPGFDGVVCGADIFLL